MFRVAEEEEAMEDIWLMILRKDRERKRNKKREKECMCISIREKKCKNIVTTLDRTLHYMHDTQKRTHAPMHTYTNTARKSLNSN